MSDLLTVDSLRAGYGAAVVLDGVNFSMPRGGSLALLGRNGVGKSTLLMTLMGLTQHHAGAVRWDEKDISSLATHKRARIGLGWVPQERLVFPSLTVEEHLKAVARRGEWNLRRVYELFPRLRERSLNRGLQLSGGEQQMLAIGRALMTNPNLLLLDEPMEGLAPVIVQELAKALRRIVSEEGLGIIIVEQHAPLALSMTKQALVLDRGQVVYSGESEVLLADRPLLNSLLTVH
ncbi:MAG: ABC transporter ATP-binding protein [Pseudomonadota bacterium]